VNQFFPLVPIIGVVAAVIMPSESVLALENAELRTKLKAITVQIEGKATGTGTIIEHDGDTYTVLTCWHVVQSQGNYQVITASGEKYQVTEIKNIPNVDLATVTFTSSTNYPTSELGDSQAIIEGTSTYVMGYPDSFQGLPEKRNLFLLKAEVASVLAHNDQGYTIIHDNPSTPGGSGGGIFDTNGRLIGINGRYISEGNTGKAYGKAIPLQTYLATRSDLRISKNVAPSLDLVSEARAKLKAEDYQGAIALFNQALASESNNLEAYYSRGEAFFSLKDYEAAIADFNRFLQLSPNNQVAYFYRGYIRAEKGDYQGAIADYNQAIQLDANLDLTYTNRGFAYAKLGDTQNAISDYDQAIQLNPESATAYYNRGLVFGRDLGDYQKALADFTKSIELAPEDAQVYVDRGNVYNLLAERRSAIDDYSQAIKLNPQHSEAHYNRGLAYSQENEPEKALEDLKRAATLFEAQGDRANYQRALDRIREIQGM
jgi:tetratricopeptide (TPR) repeat protein